MHPFRYRGRFFRLRGGVEDTGVANASGRPREYSIFRAIGRDPAIVRTIRTDAAAVFEERPVGRVSAWSAPPLSRSHALAKECRNDRIIRPACGGEHRERVELLLGDV
jgi:hypothetical protein